jgi:hypothetical protein
MRFIFDWPFAFIFADTSAGELGKTFDFIGMHDAAAKTMTSKPKVGKKPTRKQTPNINPRKWGVARNQNVRVNDVQTVSNGGETTPVNQPEPLTRVWTMGISAPAPTPIIFQQPMPANLQEHAAASSVMQQQEPFQHARTLTARINREMTQSIPVSEQPMMEAANPRTWDQQPSPSGVGSLIRAFKDISRAASKQ